MSYTLFVKPVNHVSIPYLEEKFSEFGQVLDVYIPKKYKTRQRQNFGYVKFDDAHAAARAIEALNEKEINGKIVNVEWAQEEAKTPEDMIAKKELQRQEWLEKRSELPPEELERVKSRKKRPEGPFYKRYFTAVDYPPGIGEKYTSPFQRGLPPPGQRKTFFHWEYVSPEQIQQILKNEEEFNSRRMKREQEDESP